ncbi:2Fe-2S iron-sulfur cluster-binding protein [Sphingobium sp. BYY-5]|uniref:2Fe-2S iron-sulfur cluster-binding protein n=1 Tax=Sphingobium sp. BYY-5 TaxID=2926400 RepID=UPI001FA812D0|nr:2Fe-2S iron-sulfur cluster-binding protein [Sphingobium sp. BYY-5]MCI4592124.1 2Fe-2S iron-sulfur cluster-binding protein [Sphingobium sp. BYY-5]
MGNLIVIDRSGQEHSLSATEGLSVMEAIRDNGLDELLALCGGCCSCATCHVYVELGYEHRFGPMTDDENDLLDSSDHRKATSRLSCQLVMDGEPGSIRLAIAPED